MSFLGTVGTEDWEDNIRPEDWTAKLFREYPNGGMFNEGAIPLTGFSALMGNSQIADDPKFHWWQKALAAQSTDITAGEVYVDTGWSSTYASIYTTNNAVQGTLIYLKVPLSFAQECVVGYKLTLMDTDDNRSTMSTLIEDIQLNGALSQLVLRLLKDDSATATYGIATCDRAIIMGSSFSEGTPLPVPMHYDPTEYWNYTGIHKNAVGQTGTALATKQRTADDYDEDLREQGELHAIGIEWDAMFGNRYKWTNSTSGFEQRTSMGALEYIRTYSPAANFTDYRRSSLGTGKSWVQGGAEWLNDFLIEFAVWGPEEVIVLSGNLVISAASALAEYLGWNPIRAHAVDFGNRVNTD